jgi:flagellar FliJ protein
VRGYRFRLATVLRIRRMEEETAKLELRAANVALRNAVAARDAADERYRSFTSSKQAIASASELMAERLEAGLLAEQVAATQRRAMERAASAALAQARWSNAAKRVAVLERLDARRREEHAAGELRAEVALVDDLVTARYAAEHADAETDGAGSDGAGPRRVVWFPSTSPDKYRTRAQARAAAGDGQ